MLHLLLLGPGAGVPGLLVEAEVEAGQLDVAPGPGDQLQPVAGDGFGPGALDVGPKRANVKHVFLQFLERFADSNSLLVQIIV